MWFDVKIKNSVNHIAVLVNSKDNESQVKI